MSVRLGICVTCSLRYVLYPEDFDKCMCTTYAEAPFGRVD
jgi:hypothetical protein